MPASVVGFAAYLTRLGRIGAASAGYSSVMFPVLALALATVFEDDQGTPLAGLGLMLVLAGIPVVLSGRRSPA